MAQVARLRTQIATTRRASVDSTEFMQTSLVAASTGRRPVLSAGDGFVHDSDGSETRVLNERNLISVATVQELGPRTRLANQVDAGHLPLHQRSASPRAPCGFDPRIQSREPRTKAAGLSIRSDPKPRRVAAYVASSTANIQAARGKAAPGTPDAAEDALPVPPSK